MSQHSSGPKLDTETRAGYDRRDSDHWTKLEDLISLASFVAQGFSPGAICLKHSAPATGHAWFTGSIIFKAIRT